LTRLNQVHFKSSTLLGSETAKVLTPEPNRYVYSVITPTKEINNEWHYESSVQAQYKLSTSSVQADSLPKAIYEKEKKSPAQVGV
jgi:hypothetical protein